jgi:CcmD family protein
MTALLIVPLLLWAGLFAFIWYVDGRVRALERRLNERKESRLR